MPTASAKTRLQRFLARSGIDSRRNCEQLIRDGRVTVNGRTARLGEAVLPGIDVVRLDGRPVGTQPPARLTVALNKPAGVVTTCRRGREQGTPVTALVEAGTRLFPVGRLDRDSEGLLLLTNDGDLALRLTHPRYGKEKEYEVVLDRSCPDSAARQLRQGVRLSDGPARARRLVRLGDNRLRVVLGEGRNRQLRRMCEAVGLKVVRLRRVRIGGLRLGSLRPGQWRPLSDAEVRLALGESIDRPVAGG